MVFPPKPVRRPSANDAVATVKTSSEPSKEGTGAPTQGANDNRCPYCQRDLEWWLNDD